MVRPFKVKKTVEAVRASFEYDGLSVIISQEFCPLFARATGQMKRTRPFYINRDRCKNHQICLSKLGCPAMSLENDQVLPVRHELPVFAHQPAVRVWKTAGYWLAESAQDHQ